MEDNNIINERLENLRMSHHEMIQGIECFNESRKKRGDEILAYPIEIRCAILAKHAMYIEHDFIKARQCYYAAARCAEYRIKIETDKGALYRPSRNAELITIKNNRLDNPVGNIFFAVLSDSSLVIDRFIKMNDNPEFENLWETLYLIIQNTLKDNKDGMTKYINYIKQNCVKRDKSYLGMVDTFEGIRDNDKEQTEFGLNQLVKTSNKRSLNYMTEYYSYDTTTYAKLAWRKGIEVEVNSPLVPKEMLPIVELENYPIPDFLKVLDDPDYNHRNMDNPKKKWQFWKK